MTDPLRLLLSLLAAKERFAAKRMMGCTHNHPPIHTSRGNFSCVISNIGRTLTVTTLSMLKSDRSLVVGRTCCTNKVSPLFQTLREACARAFVVNDVVVIGERSRAVVVVGSGAWIVRIIFSKKDFTWNTWIIPLGRSERKASYRSMAVVANQNNGPTSWGKNIVVLAAEGWTRAISITSSQYKSLTRTQFRQWSTHHHPKGRWIYTTHVQRRQREYNQIKNHIAVVLSSSLVGRRCRLLDMYGPSSA
jgi:hypothetical protein